jgi:hypothetical protein
MVKGKGGFGERVGLGRTSMPGKLTSKKFLICPTLSEINDTYNNLVIFFNEPIPLNLHPRYLQATFTRQGEDNGLAEIAAIRLPAPEDGSALAAPTKLRLDIGWSTWKKPKVSEGCTQPVRMRDSGSRYLFDNNGS